MNIDTQERMSGKERRALRHEEKKDVKETAARQQRMKKVMQGVGWSALGAAIIGGFAWFVASQPETPRSEILSRSGFHWHPELTIYVKGEKQEIPANIGIGITHRPIHTHEEDSGRGVVHMEFQGVVREQEAMLGRFFENWGKDMRSFGSNMRMTVNGEENTEYENYVMRDNDKIELFYE